MMAKISKGSSFRGCVNYVTRAKKDNPDGSPCDEWRLIDSKDVATSDGREEIIASFEDNQSLNPRVENVVGHISLNFHANDKDKINDEIMVEIARKYMERMGIVDTPYILVRHLDKDYPHCHLVFSRVNNYGETISDKNDFNRNRRVCLALTKEYGLHISEGKSKTNVKKLRGNERIKYEIFNTVNDAWNDNSIYTFEQFEASLKSAGVEIEYKYRRGTDVVDGLWYKRKGKKFPASKIDRRFSYGNINKHLADNKPLHPKCDFLYADGSIRPMNRFRGVALTPQQTKDYVAGKSVRLDGCIGPSSTIYIRFDKSSMKFQISSQDFLSPSQPASPRQSVTPRQSTPSSSSISTSPAEEQGFASGGGDPGKQSFKEFWKNHPELDYFAACRAYKERNKKLGIPMPKGPSL